MATPPSTPSRRLTRSQTATTVLGKRTSLSRSSSVVSNKSVSMITPESTPKLKRVRTLVVEDDDARANKENIPPLRDLMLDSPSASRLSRRSSFSSNISTASTRSRNSLRRSATYTAGSQTPSTGLNNLPIASPPPTPPSSIPLYLRVRGLLRATSNANRGMSLEGRETERSIIESFLHSLDADSDVSESVLYISGAPGTGKTALVNSIISSAKVADDVKLLFMNCMAIPGMDALWQKLADEFEGATVKGKAGRGGAGKKLQGKEKVCAILEKQRGLKCILVLDELDNLAASSSNGLQPLFALAASYPSTIRIVGIANTHTLTSTSSASDSEPVTPSGSRAKGAKIRTIHFAPYNSSELLAILNKRFENLPQDELKKLLPTPALTLLTKKVSALTGDVRVLFEVLRGAIDNAASSSSTSPPDAASTPTSPSSEYASKITVSPAHILSALKSYAPSASKMKPTATSTGASSNNEIISKVRDLGLQQRLVLLALVLASKRSAATLPLSSASSSPTIKTLPSPTKRPRSPLKRTGSGVSVASTASDPSSISSGPDSAQLYSYYATLLATADTFTSISRSEFTDILGMLETLGLITLTSPSARSFKRSSSFTGSAKSSSTGGVQNIALQAHIREGEVVRGLGIDTVVSDESDPLEEEIRKIWSREMNRIKREAKAKDALAVLEGIEGFEDAIMG
ncbi:P-loop containing nucleoside triphosphate hydrolase protein [Fomitiporia mediterranea MF3/22]|uniref:P-loop containing nucleoside triphosphate hydrolase protein n=1 Tax=Fomitiporia mediterranea (strain MF3/22) TaxID=694068 RepID=UPI0004409333|nr:P-loop containing nucleoside triphosphate hydrolase protein [Fomitiporia mediterranea MF3/22]EJD03405.1 P-loop containing nucleoside triphosphate hydrolase protein [Fomitiporia mediterranea MF3/22]